LLTKSDKNLTNFPSKTPKKGKPISLGKVKTYLTGNAFTLSWYADGERKREMRSTLEDALSRAKEINKDLDAGRGHVKSFTATETALLNTCIEQLREIGVPISQAVREYVAAHRILCGKASVEEAARTYSDDRSKADLKPIKFNEVSAEFLLRCERNGLSETYKAASRKFLKRVSRRLGSSHIQDITSKEIGNVVEHEVNGGPRAYNNLLGTISAVFSYARKQGYLSRTEKTEAELVERKPVDRIEKISIYSPDEIRTILKRIESKLVPFIALGAFAGVRTEEIFRMRWEMVDLAKGFVLLDRGFTKTRRRRIIPINQALRSWIAPLHKKTGPIFTSEILRNSATPSGPHGPGKLMPLRSWSAAEMLFGTPSAPIASQNYRTSKRCPPKWVTHQGNSANTMQSWPLLRRPRSGFLSCA
jgi:integrase